MPATFIQVRRQQGVKSVEDLASEFQVSKQAMRYRLNKLNESTE